MPVRKVIGVMAAATVLALSGVGTASADTNRNIHSPSQLCGPGLLTVQKSTSTCVARQTAEQEILKKRTQDVDLINRLNVAVPAAAAG